MNKIIVCLAFVATTTLAIAQEKKNEISVIGGMIQMNMNPGENGLGAQLQYSRQLHPWFGVEGRLGMGRYNDFPASSTFKEGDSGLYSGSGVPDEFDAYIRAIPASDAITTNWQTLTLIAADASVYISPIHTIHHRLKFYAGVTRQYRSGVQMFITYINRSLDDDSIVEYTPGYAVVNVSEWGKHYGVAYQYRFDNDWSVGATVKLTYIDFKTSASYSDHALFGLSVGRAF